MFAPFARLSLFILSCCGWGILFFGASIAWRGVTFYDWDAVLMGTGGGLAIGGLLIVALSLSAWAQLSTACDTAAMRRLMEAGQRAPEPSAKATTATLRAEPPIGRKN